MKVKITFIAELHDTLLQQELEHGYTVGAILSRIYKTASVNADYIYDIESKDVKEVK
jgi:hypothetical protein